MTRKITFQQLAAELSQATSSDSTTASDFIKELFDTVASTLANGESVTVKGIGTFINGIGNDITWVPDETLASEVNEPFAFFEAVELGDGVTEKTLEEVPQSAGGPSHPATEFSETVDSDESNLDEDSPEGDHEFPVEMPPIPENNAADTAIAQTEESVKTPPIANDENKPEPPAIKMEPESIPAESVTQEYEEAEIGEEPRRRCRLLPCITFIAGLILGLVGGYFGAIYAGDHFRESAKTVDEHPEAQLAEDTAAILPDSIKIEAVSQADTLQTEHDEQAEAAKTYLAIDTVRPHRFLTTMSRKYYGDYRFWVYIFEENRSVISDPNHLNPGTPVIIPLPEKYGIDASDKESVAKAERKSAEIQGEKVK